MTAGVEEHPWRELGRQEATATLLVAAGRWRRWGGAGMLLAAAAACKKALLARVRDRKEVLQR